MSKLTKDLNCSVTFFPFCCKFQNLSSERMIRNVEERNGLYYLSGVGFPSKPKLPTVFSLFSNSNVLLWHHKLGHPSFSYLCVCIPSCSLIKILHHFNVILVLFAKKTHAFYPPHTFKPFTPQVSLEGEINSQGDKQWEPNFF